MANGVTHVTRPSDARAHRAPNTKRGSPGRAGPVAKRQAASIETHRNAAGPAVPALVHEVLRSPGQSLDAATRAFFEARFAHDFSHVRVHADDRAARSAHALDASAYTVGGDIVFGAGGYSTGDRRTRAMLAHELAHVVQQGRTRVPLWGIAPPGHPAEVEARRLGTLSPAPGGLVYRQQKADPAPQPQPDQPKQDQPKPDQAKPDRPTPETQGAAGATDARARVRAWLDQENFNLGLILDTPPKAPEEWHAFYSEQRWTLAAITDDTWKVLSQTDPRLKRGDVWMEVYQYYQEKEKSIKSSQWQWVFQILWTPTLNLASTQPGPTLQGPGQLTAGRTYQAHKQGYGGLEHQLALTVSGLDFLSGQKNFFENSLFQYQLSLVTPVGHDFEIGGTWAALQAALNAQAAVGLGGVTDQSKGGKIYFGLMAQPGVGGQLTLNIGSLQVIAQGTIIYSWMSKTGEPGSQATGTLGVQAGIGGGVSF